MIGETSEYKDYVINFLISKKKVVVMTKNQESFKVQVCDLFIFYYYFFPFWWNGFMKFLQAIRGFIYLLSK